MRITRGAPREYTCYSCGNWMKGADNCFPGSCYECVQKEMKLKQSAKESHP